MKKSIKSIFIYTSMFSIVAIMIFISIFNNKSLLLKMDAYNQHFIFFKNYYDIIKNTHSLFSWNIALGEDALCQYAYYLIGDPFFYISLLFPSNCLKYVYTFLVIFRIYCMGLAFYAFCVYKKKEEMPSILGALIYAFSSYGLLYAIMHPFFINATIIFPLLLIGVEKFLKEDKYIFLIAILTIAIVSNFYLCYILIFLILIYAILVYLFECSNKSVNDFFVKILKAGGCFCLAFLLSCVLLLPVLYTFFNVGRSTSEVSVNAYGIQYYIKLFKNIFSVTTFEYSTTIGISSIALIFLPIALNDWKNNKCMMMYFIILTVGLIVPFFGRAMNGFFYISNRWTFAYVFVMAYLVVCGIKNNYRYNKVDLVLCNFVVIGYVLSILWLVNTNNVLILKSVSFAIFIGGLIIAYNAINKEYISKIVEFGIIAVLLLNLGYIGKKGCQNFLNNCLDMDHIENSYYNLNGNMNGLNDAINVLNEDNDFYRIGRYPMWTQNISQYLNYKSINSYMSFSNKYVKNLSEKLGNFDADVSKPIGEFDNRTRITTLLGEKYFIVKKENEVIKPLNYEKYREIGDLNIYINKSCSGPLVFFDTTMQYDDWMKFNELDRECLLTKTAVVEDDIKIEPIINYSSKVDRVEYNVDGELKNSLESKEIKNLESTVDIKFNINKLKNKELYLHISKLEFLPINNSTEFTMLLKINDVAKTKKILDKKSQYFYPMDELYIRIGNSDDINKFEWILKEKGTYRFENLEILSVDFSQYSDDIEKINKGININKVNSNEMKAEIQNEKDGIVQFATGYSKGWKVYVDGVETETFIVNGGFIGFLVTKGSHSIELRYNTPYLKIGCIVSLMTFITIIIIYIYLKLKGEKNEEKAI